MFLNKFEWLFCIILLSGVAASAARVECVNVDPKKAAAFRAGAGRESLGVDRSSGFDQLPEILVWQSDSAGAQLDGPLFERIAEHVRRGHSLLITLGRNPGSAAFRFSPISPTTAWQSLMQLGYRGNAEPGIGTGKYDQKFFRRSPVFRTNYRWRMRPVHAVERGESRLECLEREVPYLKIPRQAGEVFFSRPLLNRNWKTRLWAADSGEESLLLGLFPLSGEPVPMERLAAGAGMDIGRAGAVLMELELSGAVRCLPGNRYEKLI